MKRALTLLLILAALLGATSAQATKPKTSDPEVAALRQDVQQLRKYVSRQAWEIEKLLARVTNDERELQRLHNENLCIFYLNSGTLTSLSWSVAYVTALVRGTELPPYPNDALEQINQQVKTFCTAAGWMGAR